MQALPVCSRYVAIINKRFNDNDYECDVILESSKLFPWAQNHSKNCLSGGYEQVARLALPYFLAAADVSDGRITYLSPSFSSVVKDYVQNFINDGIGQFHCHICQENTKVKIEQLDEINTSFFYKWTEVWTCEKGHIVHKKNHEMHVNRAKTE
jgi:hypothetical protein